MARKSTLFGSPSTTLLGLLGTSLLAAALAYPGAAQSPGLQPVAPPRQPGTPSGPSLVAPNPQPASQGQSWREALTQLDFSARTLAFDRAALAARTDPALVDSLEAWAADKTQPELAWTSHLVLHQATAPVSSDPFGTPFFRHPSSPGFDGDPFESFFRGLDPVPFGQSPFGSGGPQSQGQGFSMETGPDGIKVRIETTGPNGTETQEYAAQSLEELKAAHPELFESGGPLGNSGTGQPGPGLAPFFGRSGLQLAPPTGMPRTDVLGVMVREEGPGAQAANGGLRVMEVLPGTIAASVGLAPGDLVLEVAGARVRTTRDVSAALAERSPGEALIVEWLDPKGQRERATWEPAAGN